MFKRSYFDKLIFLIFVFFSCNSFSGTNDDFENAIMSGNVEQARTIFDSFSGFYKNKKISISESTTKRIKRSDLFEGMISYINEINNLNVSSEFICNTGSNNWNNPREKFVNVKDGFGKNIYDHFEKLCQKAIDNEKVEAKLIQDKEKNSRNEINNRLKNNGYSLKEIGLASVVHLVMAGKYDIDDMQNEIYGCLDQEYNQCNLVDSITKVSDIKSDRIIFSAKDGQNTVYFLLKRKESYSYINGQKIISSFYKYLGTETYETGNGKNVTMLLFEEVSI